MAVLSVQEPDIRGLVTVLVGSVLVLGWWVVPLIAFGVDSTVDPARFVTFAIPRRSLLTGLAIAGVIGVPGVVTVGAALAMGGVWWRTPAALVVGLLCAVLAVATCIIGARATTSAASTLVTGRRFREVMAAVAVLPIIVVGPGHRPADVGRRDGHGRPARAGRGRPVVDAARRVLGSARRTSPTGSGVWRPRASGSPSATLVVAGGRVGPLARARAGQPRPPEGLVQGARPRLVRPPARHAARRGHRALPDVLGAGPALRARRRRCTSARHRPVHRQPGRRAGPARSARSPPTSWAGGSPPTSPTTAPPSGRTSPHPCAGARTGSAGSSPRARSRCPRSRCS